MRKTYLLWTLVLYQNCSANTDVPAYKCNMNGKISYSQFACQEGTTTKIEIKSVPPSDSNLKQAASEKKRISFETKKMENVRKKLEAKETAKNNALAKHFAASKKRCDNQQLRLKWAKEDLKNTQPKGEMKMREKLKRTEEKTALNCKNL